MRSLCAIGGTSNAAIERLLERNPDPEALKRIELA